MNLELESIFYEESNIPPEFTLEQQVDQREFLSDGKMIPWEGQINEVFSPICVKTKDGLQRKRIGSFPVCTEKESMAALDAAVQAFDNGRGEWPTMSVADRIICVENFTKKMIEKKDIVVKLIMWSSQYMVSLL